MAGKTERFEMRIDEEMFERVDRWRAEQQDVPTRAEAVRRLMELGLDADVKRQVSFSDGEKILMLMLADVIKGLKLKNTETDVNFIEQVIYGGHYWAPLWKMTGVFHRHADRPEDVSFVVDVLDMWSFIEGAHAKLSKAEKDRVAAEAGTYGKHAKFAGFDGNNESSLVSIARFLIDDMDRFTEFKGRELNSHSPSAERYRRMLERFEPMRETLDGISLSAEQLIELLQVTRHTAG
jgi:uncharacterized protein YfbU (UPF0304 family)